MAPKKKGKLSLKVLERGGEMPCPFHQHGKLKRAASGKMYCTIGGNHCIQQGRAKGKLSN